jgi:hypothetical protein
MVVGLRATPLLSGMRKEGSQRGSDIARVVPGQLRVVGLRSGSWGGKRWKIADWLVLIGCGGVLSHAGKKGTFIIATRSGRLKPRALEGIKLVLSDISITPSSLKVLRTAIKLVSHPKGIFNLI